MQSKSGQWWSALTASAASWRYGVDILASDEQTPLEQLTLYDQNATDRTVPKSSAVVLDTTAPTHRQFSLNLRNQDARYIPGPAGWPSGGLGSPTALGLVWYNVRYRPWMDLRVDFDAHGSPIWDRTYLGIYVLLDPDVQVKSVGSVTVLNLLDKTALLCKPYHVTNTTLPTFVKGGHTVGGYAAGTTFDSAMADLATRAGVPAGKQNFTPSALTLATDYSMTEGSEWWTHLQKLAAAMSHEVYFDSRGYLVRRPNPLALNTASQWTFAPGPLAIVSEVGRKTDLSKTFNHIIAIGGSSRHGTVRGEAQVVDPASPYHANQIGDRVVYVGRGNKLNDMTPDPAISTTAMAQSRAQLTLAKTLGQQETITIVARNIPALEPYDRITATLPQAGVAMDFQVSKLTWKLSHEQGGGMKAELTRWFTVGS